MSDYSTTINKYGYLWNKYRPAILKLMIDSADEPQEYKFSKHEFHNVNAKEKGGYSFVLNVYQSKATNDIKNSVLAKDLLVILKKSGKATELMETAAYEFTMDKQFMLTIKQIAQEEETEVETETATEVEVKEGVESTQAEPEIKEESK